MAKNNTGFIGYIAAGIALLGIGFFGGYKYATRTSSAQKDNQPRIYTSGVDFDGNGLEDLFQEDPGRKTISILWGDYIKPEKSQSQLQRTSSPSNNPGLIRFISQREDCSANLIPISRNYQQDPSSQQVPLPPQPQHIQSQLPPQPQSPQQKPEVVETPQPKNEQQEPDHSKIPSFEIQPLANTAYFDTASMIARHLDRRSDYSYIESQVRDKYEKRINDPCVKRD